MEATTPRAAEQAGKPAAPPQEKTLPPLDYAFHTLLLPLKKSLARIEARLAESNALPARPESVSSELIPLPSAEEQAIAALGERLEQLSTELADFRHEALQSLQQPPEPLVSANVIEPLPVKPAEAAPRSHDSWEAIILGNELSGNAALNAVRQRFLADVVSGVVAARALAGQLLLLQTTPPDELPERFRHVGEAYYRWRPCSSTAEDPLEQALADWLTRCADEAGLRNSIQLVRPGDRFDSTRHSAATRGVEVTAVHGWVVLRDNTKVYTKASVTVQ